MTAVIISAAAAAAAAAVSPTRGFTGFTNVAQPPRRGGGSIFARAKMHTVQG
jgi:hypothetical protein